MTNHSESAGSMPADETRPTWDWLQQRIPANSTEQFEQWLAAELESLEENFADLITSDSRKRELRRSLSRDSERSG